MSAPKLTEMPAETLPVPRILKEVSKRIVGQDAMVERLLVGLMTGGHILLEGVPGLAKTLAVRTLAEIIHASVRMRASAATQPARTRAPAAKRTSPSSTACSSSPVSPRP